MKIVVALFSIALASSLMAGVCAAESIIYSYEYDDLNRLTRMSDSCGNQIDYTYDDAGNLTNRDQVAGTLCVSLPKIVAPVDGSVLSTSEVGFSWQASEVEVDEWRLLLGTSASGNELFDSGVITDLSYTVSGLELDGSPVFATLFYRGQGGDWSSISAQYESIVLANPIITNPLDSTEIGVSEVIQWDANGLDVDRWWVYVGSSKGGRDYFDSGSLSAGVTSVSATGWPQDGDPVYIRVFHQVTGQAWKHVDVDVVTSSVQSRVKLISPQGGSTVSGQAVNVSWESVNQSIGKFWVYAGSSTGGKEIFDSGDLGDATQVTVTDLPQDGSAVHLRLWYRFQDDASWSFVDETFISAVDVSGPSFVDPVPATTLSGEDLTFSWISSGQTISAWWLYLGSAIGGAQYFDSGNLGNSLSQQVTGLPTDGSTIYARLWYKGTGQSTWEFVDASYTAHGAVQTPQITLPQVSQPLSGSAVEFAWTGNGQDVEGWWLYAGTEQGGRQYYDSGSLGSSTSATVTGLPEDGSEVWVRLFYRLEGEAKWRVVDESYTSAQSSPVVLTPAEGESVAGSSILMKWESNDADVAAWWIYAGNAVGSSSLFDSGSIDSDSSEYSIGNLPTDGSRVYIRLWWKMEGQSKWEYKDVMITSSG